VELARFETFKPYEESMVVALTRIQKLANIFISMAETIATEKYPFQHSQILILWSEPGRGKTHLIEALINKLKDETPMALDGIFYQGRILLLIM
jgi:hypothetical protein